MQSIKVFQLWWEGFLALPAAFNVLVTFLLYPYRHIHIVSRMKIAPYHSSPSLFGTSSSFYAASSNKKNMYLCWGHRNSINCYKGISKPWYIYALKIIHSSINSLSVLTCYSISGKRCDVCRTTDGAHCNVCHMTPVSFVHKEAAFTVKL